jgi:dTDP-4-dehydrorhamnose 3,5-epimerase-like enzyme
MEIDARVVGTLPHGVRIHDLACLRHDRGSLTEIFRQDGWPHGPARQWNLVTSGPGVLRGIHVHTIAAEYYVLVSGRVLVGYQDIRPGSPTFGQSALVELGGPDPVAILAPPGLAHGVYGVEAFTLLVGTTTVWDPAGELGCHWKDPALEIPWPFETAVVSSQDAARGRFQDLLASATK